MQPAVPEQKLMEGLDVQEQLDAFECAWQSAVGNGGTPPSVDQFLRRDEDHVLPAEAQLDLISIDMEYRWRIAHSPTERELMQDVTKRTVHAYVTAFPWLDSPQHLATLVCAEFRARIVAREPRAKETVLGLYPEIANLKELLTDAQRELQDEVPNSQFPEIPGFQLVEEVGRGGWGVVYKALDRDLKRTVAIKAIHARRSMSATDQSRFRREAQALARLQSPHIVTVFSVSESHDQLYLIMEWVDGCSLDQRMRQNDLSVAQVVHLMRQVAEAVHYAHENGVIHRDLKPDNILVNSSGDAVVADFGLAKLAGPEPLSAATLSLDLTETRDVVGTPCFMSPEQIDGGRGEVGPSSDVYALGASLYTVLTGRPPIRGNSTWETLQLILTSDPVRPSSLNPNIPRDLETICLRCLEKNPASRYKSALDVSLELARFSRAEPILARPLSRLTHVRRWSARYPREAALWGVIGLAVIAGSIAAAVGSFSYSRLFSQERIQRQLTEQALDRSDSSKYISQIQQARLQFESHNLQEANVVLDAAVPTLEGIDRRDWEWYYLKQLVNAGEFRFQAGADEAIWAHSLAITPDAHFVACGSSVPWYESMIQKASAQASVWDLVSQHEIFSVNVEGNVVGNVALSDSGKLLATVVCQVEKVRPSFQAVAHSTTINVYDVERQELLWSQRDTGEISIGAFSKSEAYIATLNSTALTIRDARTGAYLWQHTGVTGMRFWGDLVELHLGTDHEFRNAHSGTRCEVLNASQPSTRMRLFADERASWDGTLFATLRDEQLYILESGSQKEICNFDSSHLSISTFSPDGQLFALGRADGMIEFRNVADGRLVRLLGGHSARLRSMEFSADGNCLVSGDWSGQVVVWKLDKPHGAVVFGKPATPYAKCPVEAFSMAEGDELRAVQLDQNELKVWNAQTPDQCQSLELGAIVPQIAPGRSAAISANGAALAFTTRETRHTAWVWDLATRRAIGSIDCTSSIQFLTIDAAGRYVALAAWERKPVEPDRINDSDVYVFDCKTNRIVFHHHIPQRRIWRLALASGQPLLAIAISEPHEPLSSIVDNLSTQVEVWDYQHDQRLWKRELPEDSTLCLGLAFSPSSERIATGTLVGDVALWDSVTGDEILKLEGRLENLEDVCFNPNGTRLAAATRKQITLWGTRYGSRILTLPSPITGYDMIFNAQVAFSSNGRYLLSNQYDETVRALSGGDGRLDSE
ncbi:MAG: WD40 repeat domain-containing serine/threonine protein kinase [Pirellulaceae bacterium]